jgi:hypothetical protein
VVLSASLLEIAEVAVGIVYWVPKYGLNLTAERYDASPARLVTRRTGGNGREDVEAGAPPKYAGLPAGAAWHEEAKSYGVSFASPSR